MTKTYYINFEYKNPTFKGLGGTALTTHNLETAQRIVAIMNEGVMEDVGEHFVVGEELHPKGYLKFKTANDIYDLREHYGNWKYVIITLNPSEMFTEWEDRSYLVHFDQWGLNPNKSGSAVYGLSLDAQPSSYRIEGTFYTVGIERIMYIK